MALALGTFAFGWYAVPVVAAAWAWIRRGDSAVPVLAALSGAVAWGTLLLIPGVTGGAAAQVADLVGQAMSVGGAALVVLTLAFPALLAGVGGGGAWRRRRAMNAQALLVLVGE